MKKKALVLGSTGSIGVRTLEVLAALSDEWEVAGLAAGSRCSILAEQANEFRPEAVAIADAGREGDLRAALSYGPKVLTGPSALLDLVNAVDCDCVVCGFVGVSGVEATVRAVELGRRVALANKETLVMAGSLLMPLARGSGAMLIPIDSEHSAIFQAMQAGRAADVKRVYLTASGGPFRTWSAEAMESATV